MRTSKLTHILKSLSFNEFRDFGKFVQSPFYNQSKKRIRLYDSIKQFYPDLDNPGCNRQYLFNSMYPDELYNDDKLRNQLSLMLKLAEDYLTLIEFRSDLLGQKKYLLNQLGKKNLMEIFIQEFEHSLSYSAKNPLRDEKHYLDLFLLEETKRKSLESKTLVGKSRNLYESVLYEVNCINNFYLISIMKKYLKLNNAQRVLNLGFRYKLFDIIIRYIDENFNELQDVPYIYVFFNFISKLKGDKNVTSYNFLKRTLKSHLDFLNKEDTKNLYMELYNYCKSLQSSGDKNFGRESFALVQEMLAEGFLFESNGSIHVQTYINVAASAIRENQMHWAEEFILKNRGRVLPEYRDNAFNYNYAVLLFKKGRIQTVNKKESFETSLTHLSKVQSDDCYFYTRIKNLQLILYYELESFESALYLIDAYVHYLSKDKNLPEHTNKRYTNFTRFIKRLINCRLQGSITDVAPIKKDLQNNKNVEYHNWLLEKLESIQSEEGGKE